MQSIPVLTQQINIYVVLQVSFSKCSNSLFLPSILAALTKEEMRSALIATENTGTLEDTFKKYEDERDVYELARVLTDVAEVRAHVPKVAVCLRMAHDPFPEDKMCVGELVNNTIACISDNIDPESFTNVITSFKPSDVKPLASIHC